MRAGRTSTGHRRLHPGLRIRVEPTSRNQLVEPSFSARACRLQATDGSKRYRTKIAGSDQSAGTLADRARTQERIEVIAPLLEQAIAADALGLSTRCHGPPLPALESPKGDQRAFRPVTTTRQFSFTPRRTHRDPTINHHPPGPPVLNTYWLGGAKITHRGCGFSR